MTHHGASAEVASTASHSGQGISPKVAPWLAGSGVSQREQVVLVCMRHAWIRESHTDIVAAYAGFLPKKAYGAT